MSLDISFSKKSKRDFPIKEFIETEEKYLENLIMVRDYFSEPLRQVIHENLHAIIFFKLPELISLHSDILLELKRKQRSIGNIILNVYQVEMNLEYINIVHFSMLCLSIFCFSVIIQSTYTY